MFNNCQVKITTTSIKPLSYIRGIDNMGCKAWMPVGDLYNIIAPDIKVNEPIIGNGTLLHPFDINFTSITNQDLKDLASTIPSGTLINFIGVNSSGEVVVDTLDPVTVVSTDSGNDLASGTDGGAFFDLESQAVTEKIQDIIGVMLTSPLVYNDVLNTISASIPSPTIVSSSVGNDITTGIDGGAFFDLDSPASIEKIQDAVGVALTSPLVYNDVLNTISASIPSPTIVSSDVGNDIAIGVDGGAYFDLDGATSVEKIQNIIGATLVSPLVYNDTTNTISTTAITTVSTGTGVQGDGVGTPISANLDALPDYSGTLVVGDKFVVSGGDGKLASSSQVANFITTDVVSAMPKGNLVAGTNVSFTGGANRLIGSGDLTINVSGAAPTGIAGGDLAGTYPNPTIKANVVLTGAPTVPTATLGTNTTQVASTEFVTNSLSNLIATTLGGDSSFANTNTATLATKAPLVSPSLTGIPTAPTAILGTNTTQIANTAFVSAGYQPLDTDLTSIAALTTTSYGRSLLTISDSNTLLSLIQTQLDNNYVKLEQSMPTNANWYGFRDLINGELILETVNPFEAINLSVELWNMRYVDGSLGFAYLIGLNTNIGALESGITYNYESNPDATSPTAMIWGFKDTTNGELILETINPFSGEITPSLFWNMYYTNNELAYGMQSIFEIIPVSSANIVLNY